MSTRALCLAGVLSFAGLGLAKLFAACWSLLTDSFSKSTRSWTISPLWASTHTQVQPSVVPTISPCRV